MAKKLTPAHIGEEVTLHTHLTDEHGDEHPNAGQVVKIVERIGPNTYTAQTADDQVITIEEENWVHYNPDLRTHTDTELAEQFKRQLEAINLYTDAAQNRVEQLLIDTVHESPFNPRTNYPESEMAEMAESARSVGIMQPVLVRPRGNGSYELIFGHRRTRAAKAAGLAFLPAFVRELSDAQSAQLQAIENSQRANLDPIDEGLGYAAWIESHGITKDELVRLTGKSRTHIYNRLKLATLGEEGQKALRANRIKAEVATLIARVPGTKHQAQALKMILDNTNEGYSGELLPYRKARDMLAEKFALDMKDVLWDLGDDTLVESAGACTVCPKRSGVDPVIYVDLLGERGRNYQPGPKGENVCTDPVCFDTKKTAQLKRNQAALEAAGKTVISGNKARQAIGAYGDIKGGYIALADVKAELKKLAAKSPMTPKPQVVTIQNPRDGKTVEVVKLDDLKTAGVSVEPKAQSRQANYEAERAAEQLKLDTHNKVSAELFRQVRQKAAAAARSTLDMQWIAKVTWEGVNWEDRNTLAMLYNFERPDQLSKSIGSMGPDELGLFMLDCALVHNVDANYIQYKPETLYAAAKHYGVNVNSVRSELGIEPTPGKAKRVKKASQIEQLADASSEGSAAVEEVAEVDDEEALQARQDQEDAEVEA